LYSCSLLSIPSGILPWHFTCKYIVLQLFKPSLLLFFILVPPCSAQQFSVCFLVYCSYTNVVYFNIFLYSLSFFSSFHPPLVSSKSLTFGKNVLHI
jgi:hypothetical protein